MNVNEFADEVKTVVAELKKKFPQHGQEVLYLLAAIYVTSEQRREK